MYFICRIPIVIAFNFYNLCSLFIYYCNFLRVCTTYLNYYIDEKLVGYGRHYIDYELKMKTRPLLAIQCLLALESRDRFT